MTNLQDERAVVKSGGGFPGCPLVAWLQAERMGVIRA
jgi:hypothetical protein